MNMRCKDIMNPDVECVSVGATVREAARKMRDRNVGFLPVCDAEMRPVGAVTDRDIAVRGVAEDYKLTTSIDTIMSLEVIACRADDDVSHARALMAEHQKSRVMCINSDGRLEGVISLSDIVQFDDSTGAAILRQVSGREARSNPWRAANDGAAL
jgi:CBS domain-containing protein